MISIVLPAYNEAQRLSPTLREIELYMLHNRGGGIGEVLIVDDGSTDSTVERAMYFSLRLPLKVVRLIKNSGKWSAIRAGIREASYDWILLMDADGSAPVDTLLNVDVDGLEARNTVLFGSRFVKGAVVQNKSGSRTIISRTYRAYMHLIQSYVFGKVVVDDTQAPWKLFNRNYMVRPIYSNRFAGDLELICSLRDDVRIENVPLKFYHKRGSKVSSIDSLKMAWETAKIAVRNHR